MANVTKKIIKVKPNNFKGTKIVASIGPETHSYEKIYELIQAGVNGVRLNFSHGNHEERLDQINWARKASKELGKPVAIIQDLQGPKIRLGDFEGVVPVQEGQELRFGYKADYERSGILPTQYDLSEKIKRGQTMFLYDGRVRTTITSVQKGLVYARVENDGVLIGNKGINLPDTDFKGESLTKKDLKDLAFGATQDFDYVALSFVQHEDDIIGLRRKMKLYGMDARIIVKFETKAACARLEQIVQETDVVMIARGDLAYEIGPEAVPLVQRDLIDLCMRYGKQTIVATQMLISMVDQAQPTRAEVSDVATAVLLGADAVMLSDETTIGKYPIETVKAMKRIILYNETHRPLVPQLNDSNSGRQAAICTTAVSLANQVQATAIVAETRSGATAYQIASHRPTQPIVAVTSSERVAQQLTLVRGVKSFVRKDGKSQARKLTQWLRDSNVLAKGNVIVSASGQHPGVVGTTDTIKVRILE